MDTYTINVELVSPHPDKVYTIRLESRAAYYDVTSDENVTDWRFDGVPQGSGMVYVTRGPVNGYDSGDLSAATDDFGGVDQEFSAFEEGQTVKVYV